MDFSRTTVLASVAFLVAVLSCALMFPSSSLAKMEYSNGPGTVPVEGDPGDGDDSLHSGGGSSDAVDNRIQHEVDRSGWQGWFFSSDFFYLNNGVPVFVFPNCPIFGGPNSPTPFLWLGGE